VELDLVDGGNDLPLLLELLEVGHGPVGDADGLQLVWKRQGDEACQSSSLKGNGGGRSVTSHFVSSADRLGATR
jgi:hypothetical protein